MAKKPDKFLDRLKKELERVDLNDLARRTSFNYFYLWRVKMGYFTPSMDRADTIMQVILDGKVKLKD